MKTPQLTPYRILQDQLWQHIIVIDLNNQNFAKLDDTLEKTESTTEPSYRNENFP